jgi:hypothetical protein
MFLLYLFDLIVPTLVLGSGGYPQEPGTADSPIDMGGG